MQPPPQCFSSSARHDIAASHPAFRMRVLRALIVTSVLWRGHLATVKPTDKKGDSNAAGPHDDPWAHTYRPGAPPATGTEPQQPTLQLRGGQPAPEATQHTSADTAAGPIAEEPQQVANTAQQPEPPAEANTPQPAQGSAQQPHGSHEGRPENTARPDQTTTTEASDTTAAAAGTADAPQPSTAAQPGPTLDENAANQQPTQPWGSQQAAQPPPVQTGLGTNNPVPTGPVPCTQQGAPPYPTAQWQYQQCQQPTQDGWPYKTAPQPTQPQYTHVAAAAAAQQQHQHPRGWMPGKTPKDPWGYYAPAYDPDSDPWETDSDKEARLQQQGMVCQPAQPQQYQPPQAPPQATTGGDTQQMVANPTGYTVPPGANRWGYTLTYHPPTAGYTAHGTTAQTLPYAVAALPPTPQQQTSQSSSSQHHPVQHQTPQTASLTTPSKPADASA